MRLLALLILPIAGLSACKGCADAEDVEEDPTGTDDPPIEMGDVGSWLSMKTMTDGSPAVAFYDRDDDALGFAIGHLSGDTVSWSYEKVDSYPDENGLNAGDSGKYASMAVASDGTVWVAYQDSTNKALKAAKRSTQGTWEIFGVDGGGGSKPGAGYWASLALDSSGNPVIAHADYERGALRVSRYNGSGFSSEEVYVGEDYVPADTAEEAQTGSAGEYAKLLIVDGTEYVAFYDRGWGALRLATHSGGAWSTEIVDNNLNVGTWPDLLWSGGKLYIAYQDVTNQDLRLAVGTPGHFDTELVDNGDHVGADAALYEEGGKFGIVYFDGAQNDMKVATGTPGSWSLSTLAGTDAALGFHNETISTGGKRYVACYDYTNRGIYFSAL